MSADVLHILFINYFKLFLEPTVLAFFSDMPSYLRQPAEDFMRENSIPIKLVKAQNMEEMSRSLTGRDAKVLKA